MYVARKLDDEKYKGIKKDRISNLCVFVIFISCRYLLFFLRKNIKIEIKSPSPIASSPNLNPNTIIPVNALPKSIRRKKDTNIVLRNNSLNNSLYFFSFKFFTVRLLSLSFLKTFNLFSYYEFFIFYSDAIP